MRLGCLASIPVIVIMCGVCGPSAEILMKYFLLGLVVLAIGALIVVRALRGKVSTEPLGRRTSDIAAFSITLDVSEKPSLFVLVSSDGTINRMGTGTLENTEQELFIGKGDPAIFKAVRGHFTEAMRQLSGQTFESTALRGTPCKLTITFQFKDGTSSGFAFLYGSESAGMPEDIAEFVRAAVRETHPWYAKFKQDAAGGR